MIRAFLAFHHDEDGAIFALFAVMLAAFLGLVALSFDFGRQAATQSELQSYADNVALAAAGELDGAPDAIDRAQSAAATFIADTQTFGDGDNVLSGLTDFALTFYDRRPGADGSTTAVTDPLRARFVRAALADRHVGGVFAPAFTAMSGRGAGRESVGAQAVAGYTLYACNSNPLTFCAPDITFSADLNKGASVKLQISGGTGTLVPGSLAMIEGIVPLVDADGVCKALTGINLDLCLLGARGDRSACLATDGVDIASGFKLPTIEAGLNVRFDIFAGAATSLRNNALYAPAPNVLSNYVPLTSGAQCIGTTATLANDRMGFPLDDCQTGGGCGVYGDAGWPNGRAQFIAKNYGGVDPYPSATTRFQFYQAMVAAQTGYGGSGGAGGSGGLLGGVVGSIGGIGNALGLGLPTCASSVDPDPNRRVIVAAAIDCTSVNISAGAENVPVLEFVELFLNSPVGLDGSDTVNVEIIGSLGGGSRPNTTSTTVRDVVRLFD